MKTAPLPKQIDLRGLAARGAEVAGTVASEDLPRLAEAGIRLVAPAQVTFQLSKDEAARAVVDARISATAILQCQRCLQDMEWPLATSTLMACVWTDEEAAALHQSRGVMKREGACCYQRRIFAKAMPGNKLRCSTAGFYPAPVQGDACRQNSGLGELRQRQLFIRTGTHQGPQVIA